LDAAYLYWKSLATLLQPDFKSNSEYVELLEKQITDLAKEFCETFDPWAKDTNTSDYRQQDLRKILRSAVDTGMLLFSQDYIFEWRWPNDKLHEDKVVVTPALFKVTDKHGVPWDDPLELVSQETKYI
jgi:hypothetical protein